MGVISLPWSMEQDRLQQIKANSVHVDDNFDTLLAAVNNKLEKDGSIVPTADLPMGSHKITGLASPTADGDAVNQGWVNAALLLKANLASPEFTGTPKAPTAAAGTNSTQIATTAFVQGIVPAGIVVPYGGSSAPTGWLLCNGQAVSRTTYAALFAAIGGFYGTGDGSTTFNLPNINGRVIEGVTSSGSIGSKSDGSLPNITGRIVTHQNQISSPSGAFIVESGLTYTHSADVTTGCEAIGFDAHYSKAAYSRNDNQVHARNINMFYIIKY